MPSQHEQEPSINELRSVTNKFTHSRSYNAHVEETQTHPKEYPVDFMKEAAGMGFLGMDIPMEYGGSGLSPLEQITVMEELARAHAGLGLTILVANSLTAYPIAQFGTEKQKQQYLPRMAAGELFGCFGLTEPDTGSNAKGITLKATRDEEKKGWIVNGAKRFITSANGAGVVILAARTGMPEEREKGITAFLAEIGPDKAGVTVPEPFSKIGLPGSPLCEIYFDNFFVPDEALLGQVGEGWKVVESTLHHSRIWIAAQGLGIAQRAYDEAEKYAGERKQFGKFLREIPEVANHLSLIKRQVNISRYLVEKAARHELNSDPDTFVWASLAKLIASETSIWAAGEAMLLHGGMGYVKETPISHVWLDSSVIRIYEGTSHIQLKILEKYWDRKKLFPLFPPQAAILIDAKALPSMEDVIADLETWTTA